MKYYSNFLDAGRCYFLEGSYFNAISILKKGLKFSHDSISDRINSLIYISKSYLNLGLYSISLSNIENAINIYNTHKFKNAWYNYQGKRVYSYSRLFALKAEILYYMNNIEAAELECKTNAIDTYGGDLILSKILIKKGSFNEGVKKYINSVNKLSENRYKNEKSYIIDILCKIEATKGIGRYITPEIIEENDLHLLSKIYNNLFLNGDLPTANFFLNRCIELYKGKYNKPAPYDFNKTKHSVFEGIVNYLDFDKGFGFVLCSTWFNKHDTIYFKTTQLNKKLKVGDFVNFNFTTYFDINGIPKSVARSIDINNEPSLHKPYLASKDDSIKKVFHGLIFKGKAYLKSAQNLNLVNIFYPYKITISLSQIIEKIPSNILEELNAKNFIFIELKFTEGLIFSAKNILFIKKLEIKNSYVDKIVDITDNSYLSSINKVKIDFDVSPCIICGETEWCGTEGCPNDFT